MVNESIAKTEEFPLTADKKIMGNKKTVKPTVICHMEYPCSIDQINTPQNKTAVIIPMINFMLFLFSQIQCDIQILN